MCFFCFVLFLFKILSLFLGTWNPTVICLGMGPLSFSGLVTYVLSVWKYILWFWGNFVFLWSFLSPFHFCFGFSFWNFYCSHIDSFVLIILSPCPFFPSFPSLVFLYYLEISSTLSSSSSIEFFHDHKVSLFFFSFIKRKLMCVMQAEAIHDSLKYFFLL